MDILLFNAGSSSLKCTLYNLTSNKILASAIADWAGKETFYSFECERSTEAVKKKIVSWRNHTSAAEHILQDFEQQKDPPLPSLSALHAVGHRIVHGGEFSSSLKISSEIRSRISDLAQLAPLHNPPSLEALAVAEQKLPQVPHIAIFDTAFHTTLKPEAYTYAIPEQWTKKWLIRRYGFHGLSHAYCAERASELLQKPLTSLRLVICHLGHGCSASAVAAGKCVDTTMGFTPLEGLVMATRSGSIDPGILLYAQKHGHISAEELEKQLNHHSGLLGISGYSADMRELLAASAKGHQPSQLAIAVYCHRARKAIGALSVTMGGVDALIFTAGVGEHAAPVRANICQGLSCLGLELDSSLNSRVIGDCDIATASSPSRILVIRSREDLTMVREIQRSQ